MPSPNPPIPPPASACLGTITGDDAATRRWMRPTVTQGRSLPAAQKGKREGSGGAADFAVHESSDNYPHCLLPGRQDEDNTLHYDTGKKYSGMKVCGLCIHICSLALFSPSPLWSANFKDTTGTEPFYQNIFVCTFLIPQWPQVASVGCRVKEF